jgi:hypothetical protein
LGGFDLVDEEKPTNSLDVFNPHEPMTEEPSLFQHAVVLALRTAVVNELRAAKGNNVFSITLHGGEGKKLSEAANMEDPSTMTEEELGMIANLVSESKYLF